MGKSSSEMLLRGILARKGAATTKFRRGDKGKTYVGYSESKYRLRISLAHPRDCHFAHVQ